MKLIYDLPINVKLSLNQLLNGEEILYCTPFDLNNKGLSSDGWFVVTNAYYFVFENDDLIERTKISDCTAFTHIMAVGNGMLETTINGEDKLIIRFTMLHATRYIYISKILESLMNGETPKQISDEVENRCPKCGRMYLGGSKICHHCINKRVIVKRFTGIIKPYLFPLLCSLFIFLILTSLNLINPLIFRRLIDDYLTPRKVDGLAIVLLVLSIGLVNLTKALFDVIKNRMMVKVGAGISRDLRQSVYAKIQSLSISYLDSRKTGDLMNRVTGDTDRVQSFISNQASMGINQMITLIVITIILFVMNWKMALLILIPVPLIIIYLKFMNKTFMKMYHAQWKISDRANSILHDILSGIRVVKAFGMEKKEINRFSKVSKNLCDITANNEKRYNTIFPFLNFVMGIGNFFILYYGGRLILNEAMKLGELIQFTQYTGMIYGPLGWLTFFPRSLTDALTSTERIFEILDEEPKIRDIENVENHVINGKVTFENISFGYNAYEPVLKNIVLDVNPGEMIGLVGHSGAGKSTLINLVMRLYDVDEGKILIDGIDIKSINQKDLRSQIGVVLQETFLFSGTILQNIMYAKPDATLEEVIKSAKIANAHDFIIRFTDGYDTRVGEKGQRLSGGEKQRIAIARAILHDPKILILDEATASVDTETEYQIQEALGRLIKNRTTFAIAHRLSTLRNATRLLVLDKGKQIELGTHEELIRSKGKYYSLVMAQKEMSRTKES
ncbi:MAG: transporter [Haloplasmataceae bacterium]|nr:transporter [Haloplasmataceae bacterium]